MRATAAASRRHSSGPMNLPGPLGASLLLGHLLGQARQLLQLADEPFGGLSDASTLLGQGRQDGLVCSALNEVVCAGE